MRWLFSGGKTRSHVYDGSKKNISVIVQRSHRWPLGISLHYGFNLCENISVRKRKMITDSSIRKIKTATVKEVCIFGSMVLAALLAASCFPVANSPPLSQLRLQHRSRRACDQERFCPASLHSQLAHIWFASRSCCLGAQSGRVGLR